VLLQSEIQDLEIAENSSVTL